MVLNLLKSSKELLDILYVCDHYGIKFSEDLLSKNAKELDALFCSQPSSSLFKN